MTSENFRLKLREENNLSGFSKILKRRLFLLLKSFGTLYNPEGHWSGVFDQRCLVLHPSSKFVSTYVIFL